MNIGFESRYTLRLLRRKLGFTLLCAFVISFGIAMVLPLLMFSKFSTGGQLPFPQGDRFSVIMEDSVPSGVVPSSQRLDTYRFQFLQERQSSFEKFGAFRSEVLTMSDGESAQNFMGSFITPNLLSITEVVPLLGRLFEAEDDQANAAPVVLISHNLWRSYYGEDPDVLGLSSRINGQNHTIIGVLPPGFAYPYRSELWLPLQLDQVAQPGGSKNLFVAGLLESGVSLANADLEAEGLLNQLADEYPEFYGDTTALALPFTKIFNSNVLPIVGPLFDGLVVVLLLLVSFNVGNLLVIRSNERLSEMAVRGAVGGSKFSTVMQVMLESLAISIVAVLLGIAMGHLGLKLLNANYPDYFADFPFWFPVALQWNEISAVLLSAVAIWLLAGFYPAWKASAAGINSLLSGMGAIGSRSSGFTTLVVGAELAVSCFLLILSLDLVMSVYSANQTDFNLRTDNAIAARISFPASYEETASKQQYLDNLRSELQSNSSFNEVSFTTSPPGVGASSISYTLADRDLATDNRYPFLKYAWTSSNYFAQLNAELLAGRLFDESDSAEALSVVIVDDLFAQSAWPEQSAIGKQLVFDVGRGNELLTVVGVVQQIVQGNPIGTPLSESTFYRPLNQLPKANESLQLATARLFVIIDTPGLASSPISEYETAIRFAGSRVDRDVPLLEVMSLSLLARMQGGPFSLFASLLVGVSLVTMFLAVVGIYGVVSRSVFLRSKEIGIRRAFGSTDWNIFGMFITQGGNYLLLSFLIGGAAASLILSAMAEQIQSAGIGNSTYLVFGSVFIGLTGLVYIASYVPLRKVVAAEPGEALHYE